MKVEDEGPLISVALGITVGLLASFVQSMGLTMQRKSHLRSGSVPLSLRKSDWHQPLWVIGFVMYFTSNIFGSIFQIGALPLVILGPLGAVSLLWNAILARFLLGDVFSIYLIFGSILIAGGAVLIGVFGVVHEPTHPLEYLLKLFARPTFLIVFCLLCLFIAVVCTLAHLTEWDLENRLKEEFVVMNEVSQSHQRHASMGNGDGISSPQSKKRRRISLERRRRPRATSLPTTANNIVTDHHRFSTSSQPISEPPTPQDGLASKQVAFVVSRDAFEKSRVAVPSQRTVARTRLLLGVAYGSASGTLSGICLLFAKTGVELLILTVMRIENEFLRWQTWVIVLALVSAAVLQLWYLNKALRLVGPTLICPLAFCFYNLSGMLNGLVYYDQVKVLSRLQIALVVLGTSVLLAGVWLVSIKSGQTSDQSIDEEEQDEVMQVTESTTLVATESTPLLETAEAASRKGYCTHDAPEGDAADDVTWCEDEEERKKQALKRTIQNVYKMFVAEDMRPVRGFSIGLGAASPGFVIRPARRRSTNPMKVPHLPPNAGVPDLHDPVLSMSDSMPELPLGGSETTTSSPPAPAPEGRPHRLSMLHGRFASESGTASQPRVVTLSRGTHGTDRGQRSPTSTTMRARRMEHRAGSLTGDPYVGIGYEGSRGDLLEEVPVPFVTEEPGDESLLFQAEEALHADNGAVVLTSSDGQTDAHTRGDYDGGHLADEEAAVDDGGAAEPKARQKRWRLRLPFKKSVKGKRREGADVSGSRRGSREQMN